MVGVVIVFVLVVTDSLRWLFITNAIITVVWGCAGFFMLPDLPNKPHPRAVWFTKEHAAIATLRPARHGRAEPKQVSWTGAKYVTAGLHLNSTMVDVHQAHLYLACRISGSRAYCCTVLGNFGYNYFGLLLKSLKNRDGTATRSTLQVNAIPIGGSAIQVVCVWVWVIASDWLQVRWPLIIAQAAIALVPLMTSSVWTRHSSSVSLAAPHASYFTQFTVLGTAPLIFSWLADM